MKISSLNWGLSLFLVLGVSVAFSQDMNKVKELMSQADTASTDESLRKIYGDLCWEYTYANVDSAFFYGRMALSLTRNCKCLSAKRSYSSFLGNVHQVAGTNDSALYYYRKARKYAELDEDTCQVADNLLRIGNIQNHIGTYAQAQSTYFKAIALCDRCENRKSAEVTKAYCYKNLVYSYYKSEMFDEARRYVSLAEPLFQQFGSPHELASLKTFKAMVITDLGKTSDAIKLYKEAGNVFQECGDLNTLAQTYSNLAVCYRDISQLDSARIYYKKSINLQREIGNERGEMFDLLNIGILDQKEGNYSSANNSFKKALTLAHKLHVEKETTELEGLLAENEAELGNFETAYAHQKAYLGLYQKQFNEQKSEQMIELEKKYEANLLKKDLKQSELEKSYAAKELISRNWIIAFGILLIILLAILLAVIYRQYKSRKKSDEEKTILLHEIHHRVKNNLQMVSSLLNIQARELNDENIKKVLEKSHDRIKVMWMIHEKLCQEDRFGTVVMEEYLGELVDYQVRANGVEGSDLEVKTHMDNIEMSMDKAISIGLILNELLTNAFKYGLNNKEPLLKVELRKKSKSELELIVTDNGPGYPDNVIFSHPKSSGGLRLVKIFSKEFNGKLQFLNQGGAHCQILLSTDA